MRHSDLSDVIELSEDCIREFRERGHTVVRGLVRPEEVAGYRPAILEAGPKGRYDHRQLEERDTYGKAFVQIFNLWTHDPRVRAFVFARRFAKVAADLMGVDGVGPLDHPSRALDAAIWLGGAGPDEPAAGPLNPVLYPARAAR